MQKSDGDYAGNCEHRATAVSHTPTSGAEIHECGNGDDSHLSIAQRQYRIPLPAVQKYMSAVMATIVTYEASVWAGKAKQVKPRQDLNSAQRGVLVRLTGAYRTTSTDALQVIAGTLPMDLEVLKNASAYWLRKGETDRIEELLQVRPDSKTAIHERVLELWQERWAS
ncbi:hypothetical protein QE152_g30578 [Popillia japonica]|uniref:Uncharacterized protein n=1 Tax=Popillia japonica TaxID=7064 RepID=A0AAW1JDJ7_POPJA